LSVNGVDQGPPDRIITRNLTDGGCPLSSHREWDIGPLPPGQYTLYGQSTAVQTLPDVWICGTGGAETTTMNPGDTQSFTCVITVQ
jgi:hypothetical protein